MLANMATSLILHKRIKTTLAKAKALRVYVEPVITRAKEDTTHNRRMAFRYLASKDGVKELFDEIANRIADRPGGYTRIIRMGNRLGDNAEMAMIELVDYNTLYTQSEDKKKSRKRRTRRGSAATEGTAAPAEETVVEDTVAEETPEDVAPETVTAEADAAPEVDDTAGGEADKEGDANAEEEESKA